jgi:hypothetical protein
VLGSGDATTCGRDGLVEGVVDIEGVVVGAVEVEGGADKDKGTVARMIIGTLPTRLKSWELVPKIHCASQCKVAATENWMQSMIV